MHEDEKESCPMGQGHAEMPRSSNDPAMPPSDKSTNVLSAADDVSGNVLVSPLHDQLTSPDTTVSSVVSRDIFGVPSAFLKYLKRRDENTSACANS